MKVRRYCLGFCFDPERKYVLLIQKNRPDWAKGLFNGLGGACRDHREEPHSAMVREFLEECGLQVPRWRQFALMSGSGQEVHIFETTAPDVADARSRTDEPVTLLPVEIMVNPQLLVPSLSWMIPLAMDTTKHVYIQSTRNI